MKPYIKHYNRLTGEERFHLYIAAMTRGDHAEAAALGDTCPTFTYSMRDWSFHRSVHASIQLVSALALELAPHLTVLRELNWQARHLGESMELLKMSGIEAAIEAHWQIIDPDGVPESRAQRGLPMPDAWKAMAGAAGAAFYIAKTMIEAQHARRDAEAQAVAVILAGFDQFTRKHWMISGEEAIASHAELFPELEHIEGVQAPAAIDDAEKAPVTETFTRLWGALLSAA